MKRLSSLAAGTLLVVAAQSAQADDSWVCGQHVIETGTGTTREEVLDKCGPPSAKDPDRWYYKNQTGGVTVVLVFQIGTLEQIYTVPGE